MDTGYVFNGLYRQHDSARIGFLVPGEQNRFASNQQHFVMEPIQARLQKIDWNDIGEQLHQKGFALATKVLNKEESRQLVELYSKDSLYRKTISMQRYRFGAGEYRYFKYPLPAIIDEVRRSVYANIVPVANTWMQLLGLNMNYPHSFEDFRQRCHEKKQDKPTVLILKYGEGDFNTLHQDLYGELYFPIQLVFFLNEPRVDYEGGEFVITEQIPRAQSKANVLSPGQGDMLLFTTNFRPAKGSRGYYRVAMKHGVSPVHKGKRHTLGIIFHDALS